MIEIGRTLSFPFQMTCIDSKVRDVIPIPGILADLEINLDENSGVKQHKLYLMCFNRFQIDILDSIVSQEDYFEYVSYLI